MTKHPEWTSSACVIFAACCSFTLEQ
jgi:hypothetical protein